MRQPFRSEYVAWGSRSILGILLIVTAAELLRTMSPAFENPWDAAISLTLMMTPLLFLFIALDVLIEAIEQHLMTHHLTRTRSALLRWTPRVGGLLFAMFMSVFALDVFGAGYSFSETIGALFMHLLPTFAVLIVLAIAWRWPRAGGIAVLAVAAVFVVRFGWAWGSDWLLYMLFVGPPVVIGLLFLANWWLRNELTINNTTAVRIAHHAERHPDSRF